MSLERTPAPNDGTPACYGYGYRGDLRMCRRCGEVEKCRVYTDRWGRVRSLMERWVDALSTLDVTKQLPDSEGVEDYPDVVELYARIYRKHFGRFPRMETLRKGTWRNMLAKAQALCDYEDLDLAVWITANMHGLAETLKRYNRPFMPNMLVGDRARARYNIYIRKANRRHRRAKEDAFDYRTEQGRLFDSLVSDEEEIGAYYLASHLAGELINWDEARARALPSEDAERSRNKLRYGKIWAAAQLQAAVVVTAQYEPDLPNWIGIKQFSWEALAVIVVRLYRNKHVAGVSDAVNFSGVEWRPGTAKG